MDLASFFHKSPGETVFGFIGAGSNLGRGDERVEIPSFHLGMVLARLLPSRNNTKP
jgi:hypothetical protein